MGLISEIPLDSIRAVSLETMRLDYGGDSARIMLEMNDGTKSKPHYEPNFLFQEIKSACLSRSSITLLFKRPRG